MSYNSKYKGSEVEALLDKVDTLEVPDVSGLATKEELNGKQDKITDLDTIRSGAAKGATAVQPGSLAKVATSGSYNDLDDKPDADVYITDFTVDDLFIGIDFALANPDRYYHLDASIDLIAALAEGKTILIPYRQDPGYLSVIRAWNDGEAVYLTIARETTLIELELSNEYLHHNEIYLTADTISIEKISVSAEPDTIVKRSDSGGVNATAWHDDTGHTWVTPTSSQDTKEGADYILQEYISDLDDIRDGASKGATAVQPSSLSSVATSGSYNDLSNKPTIPAAVTESTVSGWGFTKNKGTVTGVKINGTTKSPTSGVVDLGTVITSHQDISGKQDKLVSGTNIKTINGASILGSGNITIEGGGGTSSNDRIAVLEISTDTLNNQFYEYGGQLNGIAEECGTTWDNICNTVSLSDLLDYITSGHLVVIFDEVLNYLRSCSIVHDQQGELLYITIPGYITLDTQYASQINRRSYELQINLRDDTVLLRRYYHTQVSSAYPEINHGTNSTTWDLAPNTFNIWGEVPELYLTLMSETPEIANEFLFQFTSGSEPTTLTIDNQIGDTDIKWANGEAPVIEANKIYQISILKGLGSVLTFDNAPSKIINTIKRQNSNLVFDYPVASDVTVVFYGRSANTAQSSPPTTITLVYSTGEQSKAIGTLFNFVTVTPSEDDTYIYTF